MLLQIGVVGVNFKTAELRLREAMAKTAQKLAGEKSLFFPHPTVLLSTCNRTEIYFSSPDLAEAHSDLLSLLRSPFEHRLYSYFGVDCLAHLCRVTAGLDSAIPMETEIQAQVKVAYGKAAEILALPSPLHYLFQKALKVAKSVRTRLSAERGAPTLFGTLWALAKEHMGDLQQRRILLVGHSEIHRGLAAYLAHRGVRNITFCTRSPEKVQSWSARGREELSRWPCYDLISCASASNDFLIRGMGKTGTLLFDLSVPRNIDPRVATRGAHLYNIEQIGQIIEKQKSTTSFRLQEIEGDLRRNALLLARLYRDKVERAASVL